MKIKIVLLSVCLLALGVTGYAQTKKTTAALSPDQVVKNLYAAQKVDKTNPFVQIKSRALVDKYFAKDLADLIWKTNTSDTAWNVDPLFNSQDPEITNFVVGKPREDGSPDNVHLKVMFDQYGKAESVGFSLRREANTWKIDNIDYSDGEDLSSMLRYSTDAEYMKDYDDDQTFKGGYMVGSLNCDVMPTMNRLFYRVTCEGQDGFKLYMAEGDEKETAFINTDDSGKEHSKFIFRNGENNGKFFDGSGKEVKVTRILTPAGNTPSASDGTMSPASTPGDTESELVAGELQVGKTDSVILYFGQETGDYAAYCFANNSEAGRSVLAACKDNEQCEVKATLGEGSCTVPGLEADLSAAFRIVKVDSAKSTGPRK